MWIGTETNSAEGKAWGWIYNTATGSEFVALTQLPTNRWKSNKVATLGVQVTSAGGTVGDHGQPWAWIPNMRVAAVHGLDDGHPAMAAALRQLAALTDDV